jgi:hypothetical protein
VRGRRRGEGGVLALDVVEAREREERERGDTSTEEKKIRPTGFGVFLFGVQHRAFLAGGIE